MKDRCLVPIQTLTHAGIKGIKEGVATISLLNHANQVIKKFSRNNQALKDDSSSAVSLNFC